MDDVQAIKNLIYSYAELLDTGDIAGLRRLFASTTLRIYGSERALHGAASVRQLVEDAVQFYDGIPSTKHLISNVIVEIADDGHSATARSYFVALQARPELPLQPIISGRWHDRFERAHGAWRFAERMIYPDLFGSVQFHLKGDTASD